VAEIWRAFGLKPWRQDNFKVSPDPDLVEKIRDALDRTAPTLPTTPKRATHDYERNGTVDLFAALDIARATGRLRRRCHRDTGRGGGAERNRGDLIAPMIRSRRARSRRWIRC
jgi:hypothetical protein